MAGKSREYVMNGQADPGPLRAGLDGQFSLVEELPQSRSCTYFDSFDWRLHAAGCTLRKELVEGECCFILSGAEAVEGSLVLEDDLAVRFARDFPEGPLQEKLAVILEVRALFPVARLLVREQTWRVVNHDQEPLLKLCFSENTLQSTGVRKRQLLLSRLRVLPVKGHRDVARQVEQILQEGFGLTPSEDSLLQEALTALGKKAGGDPPRVRLQLDGAMRTDAAAKAILLGQLDILEANEAGTVAALDTEFLHDFRVAVRRTRSLLGQIKEIFPNKKLMRFRDGFAWLGQVTGPTRDLDVYLLHYDDYVTELPLEVRDDLQPLHTFLQTRQQKEQARLAKALRSHRYRQLVDRWRIFLQAPLPARTTLGNAMRPVSQVAGEQIAQAYRRVIKQGKRITRASPASDLHRLRKSCKKLRYLLEFFQSLYPPTKITKLIKGLKLLQDNLGAFQDLEVQSAALREMSQQMVAEQETPAETLVAMGMLVASLNRKQQQVRKAFKAQFAEFHKAKYRRLFEDLFPS
jgi:CHAD domain-containing protein